MKRILLIIFFINIISIYLFPAPVVHALDIFKVLKVVDGDTIVVDVRGNREVVRLLGIDTPESVDPRKPVQCFAQEATAKLKSLLIKKSVILVDDSTQGNRDKYNRLLRYVFLPDSVRTFVNGEMIKQGYAFSYREYPTKMLNKFNNFEVYARDNSLGLWGACPLKFAPTPKPKIQINSPANPAGPVVAGYTCSGKTSCRQMATCAEAQFYLNTCGISKIDGDTDGTPCEAICR